MNIVIITKTFQIGGGMEKYSTVLCNYLVNGCNETVTTILLGKRYDDEYEIDERINVVPLNELRNSNGFIDGLHHNLSIVSKINSQIKTIKPDIVLSFIPAYASLVKIFNPRIKVIGCLRVNPDVDIKGKKDRFLTITCSRILNGFIFQTKKSTSSFPKKIIRRSVVIPNSVDSENNHIDLEQLDTRRIVYASGRLSTGKRFEDIIRAFKIAHDKYEDYRLVILGDGEKKNSLIKLASELGLENSVEIIGPFRNVTQRMLDGCVYVFASDAEGYPNALAEALTIGLPCIATDCNYGPSEMIDDHVNGSLVPVGDVNRLSEAIIELIENPELCVSYSENTITYAATHSPNKILRQYYEYIKHVEDGVYDISIAEKISNKLCKTEFTVGWAEIKDDDDIATARRKEFSFLPLNGKEWYADPILYEKENVTYVFMELYENDRNKGCIAVSKLDDNGLTKPEIIIREKWHLSFPFIFEMDNDIFMIPESNEIDSICVYKCVDFPYKWKMITRIDNEKDAVDTILIEKDHIKYLITSVKNEHNKLYTKMIVGELKYDGENFFIDRSCFEDFNLMSDFALNTRNGGAPIYEKDRLIRVAQVSTPIYYGIGLKFYEVDEIDRGKYSEHEINELDVNSIDINLLGNYYRYGIHTYGKNGRYEVVDLAVKRL